MAVGLVEHFHAKLRLEREDRQERARSTKHMYLANTTNQESEYKTALITRMASVATLCRGSVISNQSPVDAGHIQSQQQANTSYCTTEGSHPPRRLWIGSTLQRDTAPRPRSTFEQKLRDDNQRSDFALRIV